MVVTAKYVCVAITTHKGPKFRSVQLCKPINLKATRFSLDENRKLASALLECQVAGATLKYHEFL